MTDQLTPEERREWESMKYSPRVASVYLLDSDRFVVWTQDWEIQAVFKDVEDFNPVIASIKDSPLEEYRPPRERIAERPRASLRAYTGTVKPMSPEEAAAMAQLLGNDFKLNL